MKATTGKYLRPSLLSRGYLRILLLVWTALGIGLLSAPAAAVSLHDHPELRGLIDNLAERNGFDRAALRQLFAEARLLPEVVTAIERPREALPWPDYRRGFVTEDRIRNGVRYWRAHRRTLARAERDYGVPAELIVAIIGVESHYGDHRGAYTVLDALLTLTLEYPPRREFFRHELDEFLLLTRELKLDAGRVKGSYAGALGIPQFIPSSYRRYAVDFDGDAQRDLFRNSDDAIGSVANFLKRHGWAAGQPVVDPARVEGPRDALPEPSGAEPVLTLHQWLDRGVVPKRDSTAAAPPARFDDERAAALIALRGESGPLYHLGYNNFYVITRYNRSHNYAMAVYELARMIRNRYQRES